MKKLFEIISIEFLTISLKKTWITTIHCIFVIKQFKLLI